MKLLLQPGVTHMSTVGNFPGARISSFFYVTFLALSNNGTCKRLELQRPG